MKKILAVFICVLVFGLSSTIFAQSYIFSTNLQVGSLGQDVTNLQTWLISNRYDIPAISSGVAAKGYFGTQTKLAVQKYQIKLGLPPTGFVGPLTRGKLNSLNSPHDSKDFSFKITSPNNGESWQRGTMQNITWNAPQFFRATYVDIQLEYPLPTCAQPGQSVSCMIAVREPVTIARSISIDNHSFSWKVGDAFNYSVYLPVFPSQPGPSLPDGRYNIVICQVATTVCVKSDKPFTVYSSVTPPSNQSVTITDPQAAEILYRGTTKTIRWTTQGSPSLVSIYLYKYSDPVLCPAGYSCMPVAPVHYLIEQLPNPSFYNNQYDWLVGTATQVAPEKNTTKYPEDGKYFVRICRDETGVDNATGKCDSTDSYITIATDTTCPKGYVCMNKSN